MKATSSEQPPQTLSALSECRSLNILHCSAAALAWAHGERPPPESTDEDRPLALPPFLSDSEVADVSISCLPGSFDPEKLRGIMQEHGFAIVLDVLSAQECSDLTVCAAPTVRASR
jgi:hypothetical protein